MEREAAEAKLASYEDPEKLENIRKLEYAYYKETVQVYEDGIPPHDPFFRIPQTIVSLGDVVFIPTPFEIFSEISLRLREYSGVPHTLALSNTNGYREYLPTEDQLCRGGYEVQCFRFGGAYSAGYRQGRWGYLPGSQFTDLCALRPGGKPAGIRSSDACAALYHGKGFSCGAVRLPDGRLDGRFPGVCPAVGGHKTEPQGPFLGAGGGIWLYRALFNGRVSL
jgi:hypothetical protein